MDELIEEILGQLKNKVKGIKVYYDGEVVRGANIKQYLPVLMVDGTRTNQRRFDTCRDEFTYTIFIKVVDDMMQHVTDDVSDTPKIMHKKALRQKMEGRDENGKLRNDTVAGILKNNLTGSNYLYNDDYAIDYFTEVRGKFFYVEATLTCTFTAYKAR